MNEIALKLNDERRGAFLIEREGKLLAEMAVRISGNNLVVYHTEVDEKLRGQGVASNLLAEMVNYARKQKLKVVPLCPYVYHHFERQPEKYADIWNKEWHRSKLVQN
jgi:predicted GNAT family acetyltransferase